jgi:flagellar hook-associated protein 1 FlgK
MSLAATLSTALTGLDAAQRALAVTANNVANAGTDGYSRKKVTQETVVVDGQGRGVRAADVSRVVDDYLAGELRLQAGRLGRDQALTDTLARVQDTVFGAPGDAGRGISPQIDALAAALESFAANPESTPLRVAVASATADLFDRIDGSAEAVQTIRRDVDREIGQTVQQIDADLLALDDINKDIARAGATAELLDRRDALIGSLARNLDVTALQHDDGTVSIYTAGGVALLEDTPRVVVYGAAAHVGETTTFGAIAVYRQEQMDPATGAPLAGEIGRELVSGGVRAALTPELQADAVADTGQVVLSTLSSGRLQGLIDSRDRALPELADQLGELAGLARYALNAAHNAAAAHPPPTTLAGSRTDLAGFDGSLNSGTAYLAVVDRSSGAAMQTIAIDVTAATAGDVVAQLNADLGALGTASIGADGALRIALADAGQGLAIAEGDSRITVVDAAGHTRDYGFSHYFGLNDLVVADGPAPTDLTVRADIAADGRLVASSQLAVAIGPPPTSTLGGAGDNRGAQALAAALDRSLATVSRGSLAGGSTTIAGYAADLTALSASAASRAEARAAAQSALVDDLAFRQGEVSGVNLDEELSRLVTYQQAYTMSARLISITDELFGELLAIKR